MLKDWKKTRDMDYWFTWFNLLNQHQVQMRNDKIRGIIQKNAWYVWVNEDSSNIDLCDYVSKNKALHIAMDYMKKH